MGWLLASLQVWNVVNLCLSDNHNEKTLLMGAVSFRGEATNSGYFPRIDSLVYMNSIVDNQCLLTHKER